MFLFSFQILFEMYISNNLQRLESVIALHEMALKFQNQIFIINDYLSEAKNVA